jgi:hypothetical protein
VGPQEPARSRIQGFDDQSRADDVHHSIYDERRTLHRSAIPRGFLRCVMHPGGTKLGNVVTVDLIERGVVGRSLVSSVDGPTQ